MAIGVVIGNLGTPRSPSVPDVKSYLKEFLMDPYVIDKPWWFRWPLVHLLITPFRAARSAHAYQSVWTPEGSPLLSLSQKTVRALQKELGAGYKVVLGMRYGEPSLSGAIESVKDCEKIILFPQYPQYAESSYKTWMDEAEIHIKRWSLQGKVTSICPFYSQPEYLEAMEAQLKKNLAGFEYDLLLFSYHGLPERHLRKLHPQGHDCFQKPSCHEAVTEPLCYRAQCYSVSRELARRLGIPTDRQHTSFQSRLGRDPWIQPFTDVVLRDLPQQGVKKLAIAMPAFTVDCLETLEEIHITARRDFLAAGGQEFLAIPCLNDDAQWVRGMSQMIQRA